MSKSTPSIIISSRGFMSTIIEGSKLELSNVKIEEGDNNGIKIVGSSNEMVGPYVQMTLNDEETTVLKDALDLVLKVRRAYENILSI